VTAVTKQAAAILFDSVLRLNADRIEGYSRNGDGKPSIEPLGCRCFDRLAHARRKLPETSGEQGQKSAPYTDRLPDQYTLFPPDD